MRPRSTQLDREELKLIMYYLFACCGYYRTGCLLSTQPTHTHTLYSTSA